MLDGELYELLKRANDLDEANRLDFLRGRGLSEEVQNRLLMLLDDKRVENGTSFLDVLTPPNEASISEEKTATNGEVLETHSSTAEATSETLLQNGVSINGKYL